MMTEGIKIMFIGMGTVFIMLGSLVAATVLSAGIIRRFSPPGPLSASEHVGPPAVDRRGGIAAAITAALMIFRGK